MSWFSTTQSWHDVSSISRASWLTNITPDKNEKARTKTTITKFYEYYLMPAFIPWGWGFILLVWFLRPLLWLYWFNGVYFFNSGLVVFLKWDSQVLDWDSWFFTRRVRGRIDCSQSPIFAWDRRDIARFTVNGGHLDFQMYRGGGRRGL